VWAESTRVRWFRSSSRNVQPGAHVPNLNAAGQLTEAVFAIGAAILGANCEGWRRCPRTPRLVLGRDALNRIGTHRKTVGGVNYETLIERNTTIPTSKKGNFSTARISGGRQINVPARRAPSSPRDNRLVGTVTSRRHPDAHRAARAADRQVSCNVECE